MPTKTKRDEEKWDKAKGLAKSQGKAENYAYIMGIYKKMKPDYEFQSGPDAKKAKDKSQELAIRQLLADDVKEQKKEGHMNDTIQASFFTAADLTAAETSPDLKKFLGWCEVWWKKITRSIPKEWNVEATVTTKNKGKAKKSRFHRALLDIPGTVFQGVVFFSISNSKIDGSKSRLERKYQEETQVKIRVEVDTGGGVFNLYYYDHENQLQDRKSGRGPDDVFRSMTKMVVSLTKEKIENSRVWYLYKLKQPEVEEVEEYTLSDVTSYLKSMRTRTGGRTDSIDVDNYGWSLEPRDRQRLDHYGNDGDGWDEDLWEDEYAGPLRSEVIDKLEDWFGKNLFDVEIGEKGHIEVSLTKAGKKRIKKGSQKQGGSGFDFGEFGFDVEEEPIADPETTARLALQKQLGELPQLLEAAPMFSGNVRNLIGDRVHYFARRRAWFVYIDAPAVGAVKMAKRAQKKLRGTRTVRSSQPILRGRTLYVGSNDGKTTKIAPIYKAANSKVAVSHPQYDQFVKEVGLIRVKLNSVKSNWDLEQAIGFLVNYITGGVRIGVLPKSARATYNKYRRTHNTSLMTNADEVGKSWLPFVDKLLVSAERLNRRYKAASQLSLRYANSNAKVVEVPNTYHAVKVEPPKATRKEFPFEGYIDFQGIKIDVENVKGSTRSGTGPEGDWSTFMHAHYGEIRGTEGTDGDKLDVYVGDNHDSSLVVVIHQHNPWDGKYDEDKVVIGCESVEESIGLYKKQYDRPGFFKEKEFTAMPIGAFWRWVHDKNNKGKRVRASASSAGIAEQAGNDLARIIKGCSYLYNHHMRDENYPARGAWRGIERQLSRASIRIPKGIVAMNNPDQTTTLPRWKVARNQNKNSSSWFDSGNSGGAIERCNASVTAIRKKINGAPLLNTTACMASKKIALEDTDNVEKIAVSFMVDFETWSKSRKGSWDSSLVGEEEEEESLDDLIAKLASGVIAGF